MTLCVCVCVCVCVRVCVRACVCACVCSCWIGSGRCLCVSGSVLVEGLMCICVCTRACVHECVCMCLLIYMSKAKTMLTIRVKSTGFLHPKSFLKAGTS